jgi:hypothetical protein
MKRIISVIISVFALLALVVPVSASTTLSQSFPYFNIQEVVKDQTVTIQTYNFPANDTFTVTMGAYGSYGIGGVVVGSIASGAGGSFEVTYDIPASLMGSERVAIRLSSPTSGYFAYNWFWNITSIVPSGTPSPSYSGFPTFSIESVVSGQSVTILTKNLPPHDTFTVTMGKYGTKGVGGVVVSTTDSGEGGSLELTYNIPSDLANLDLIAIRLQSPVTGYFAFNWFYNTTTTGTPTQQPTPTATPTTTPTATPTPSGYSGYPTFTIKAVVKDSTVTIEGTNFPPDDTFTVLMGVYGSLGIGGTTVGSTQTGAGGSLSATYNIPPSLVGASRIAIRLQSPTSGYFAYNWFYNSTTP